MFSQHLFLLCLSSFYLSLLNPSVLILSVTVCLCERWLRVKHLTLSKRKMMKTRVKSPTFIKVRPELINTPTTDRHRSGWCHTCSWHCPRCCVEAPGNDTWQGWKMCFAPNMEPFSCKMFSLTSRPPCCLSLEDICLWSKNIILCNKSVHCCLSFTFTVFDFFKQYVFLIGCHVFLHYCILHIIHFWYAWILFNLCYV